MKINNQYFYELTDRFGTIEVDVLNEKDFQIDFEREEEFKFFYSRNFNGKLILKGSAFKRLKKIELSYYVCSILNIKIFKECNSQRQLLISLDFDLLGAEWDDAKCVVSIKVKKSVPDKCLESNKSEKINVFDYVPERYAIKAVIQGGGVFEYLTYTQEVQDILGANSNVLIGQYIWNNTTPPSSGNWQPYRHQKIYLLPSSINPSYIIYQGKTNWVREIIIRNSNEVVPNDWILLQDNTATNGTKKYAKKAVLGSETFTATDTDQVDSTLQEWKIIGATTESGKIIDNGMKLGDVINVFASKFCGAMVVSDFFQINPENPSSVNYVTGETSDTNEILVFQKSDVKRPNVSGNATKAEMTWDKLIENLWKIFNVAYSFENGILRIEHISWFDRNQGLDLTQPKYKKWTNGKTKYTYLNEAIPKIEEFLFKEVKSNAEWNTEIQYNKCSSGKNKETIAIDNFTTDIEFVLSNPESDSNKVEDEGFVIVSAKFENNEYFVNTDIFEITPRLNNVFSFHNLVLKYHFHNRYLKKGTIKNVQKTFISVRPNKKGETLLIPFCCDDVFNPNDKVKTDLGIGIVEKATFNFQTKLLELNILYDGFEGYVENVPPTITGFEFGTFMNYSKTLPFVTSDDEQIVETIVSNSPQHGTLVLNSSNEFTYTPNVGFEGHDVFEISVKDNWGEVSTGEFVVRVVQGVPNQSIAVDDNFDVFHGTSFSSWVSIMQNDTGENPLTLENYNVTTNEGVPITIGIDGKFSYTPPTNFQGTDWFEYSLTKPQNQTGDGNVGRVNLNVYFVDRPIAVEDNYLTQKNVQLIVDGMLGKPKLTENDYTLDGVPYSFTTLAETKATQQGGAVVIENNGNFTYTPPTDFEGIDSFQYTSQNANGSDIGDVNVSVAPIIYVKLIWQEFSEQIYDDCGGGIQNQDEFQNQNPNIMIGESGNALTFMGWSRRRNFSLQFFSDSLGTQPIDVTGLNFRVNYSITSGNNGVNTTDYFQSNILNGETDVLLNFLEVYRDLKTCTQNNGTFEATLNLVAGSYEIIT